MIHWIIIGQLLTHKNKVKIVTFEILKAKVEKETDVKKLQAIICALMAPKQYSSLYNGLKPKYIVRSSGGSYMFDGDSIEVCQAYIEGYESTTCDELFVCVAAYPHDIILYPIERFGDICPN